MAQPDRPVPQCGWGTDIVSIWDAIPCSDWRCCKPYNRNARSSYHRIGAAIRDLWVYRPRLLNRGNGVSDDCGLASPVESHTAAEGWASLIWINVPTAICC